MDEFAEMQQGRSRAVNSGVKPEGTALPPKELGNEVPNAKKNTSVRESLGKKPDAPTVKTGHHPRL